MEYYCKYQERCHDEVYQKLFTYETSENEKNEIIVYLIENDCLNEERFVMIYAISKFHQKKWGKIRISQELKLKKISSYLIKKAIESLPKIEYETTFHSLAEKHWFTITEKNSLKKRKKYCDFLLRKGWESNLVYAKAIEMEQES